MPTRSTFCNEILSETISIPPYSRQHLTDAGNEKKLHPPSDSTTNIRMVKKVIALAESVLTDKSAAFFRLPSVRKAIRARYRSIDIPRGKDRATFLYNEAGVSWITMYHMVQLVVAMMNEVAQPNTEHCWTIQTMMERQINYVTQDVNTNVRTRVEKPLLGRVSRTAKPDITFAFGTLNSRAGSIYDQQVSMYNRTDFPKFGFLELKDHHIDIAEIRDLVKNPNRGFPINSTIYMHAKQWTFYSVSTSQPWASSYDGKTIAIAHFSDMEIMPTIAQQWIAGVGDTCELYATDDPDKIYKIFHGYLVIALHAMTLHQRQQRGVKRPRDE